MNKKYFTIGFLLILNTLFLVLILNRKEHFYDTTLAPSETTTKGPSGTTTKGPSGTTTKGPSGTTTKGPSGTTTKGPSGTTTKGPSGTTQQPSNTTTTPILGTFISDLIFKVDPLYYKNFN